MRTTHRSPADLSNPNTNAASGGSGVTMVSNIGPAVYFDRDPPQAPDPILDDNGQVLDPYELVDHKLQKATHIDWLNKDLKALMDSQAPTAPDDFYEDGTINPSRLTQVASELFRKRQTTFVNMYQLKQCVTRFGAPWGFAVAISGLYLHCCQSPSFRQKQTSASDVTGCPFRILVAPHTNMAKAGTPLHRKWVRTTESSCFRHTCTLHHPYRRTNHPKDPLAKNHHGIPLLIHPKKKLHQNDQGSANKNDPVDEGCWEEHPRNNGNNNGNTTKADDDDSDSAGSPSHSRNQHSTTTATTHNGNPRRNKEELPTCTDFLQAASDLWDAVEGSPRMIEEVHEILLKLLDWARAPDRDEIPIHAILAGDNENMERPEQKRKALAIMATNDGTPPKSKKLC